MVAHYKLNELNTVLGSTQETSSNGRIMVGTWLVGTYIYITVSILLSLFLQDRRDYKKFTKSLQEAEWAPVSLVLF